MRTSCELQHRLGYTVWSYSFQQRQWDEVNYGTVYLALPIFNGLINIANITKYDTNMITVKLRWEAVSLLPPLNPLSFNLKLSGF